MRLSVLLSFVIAFANSAWAGPPVEVIPETQIALGVGQIRVYRFDDAIGRIDVLTKGTVEASAQTDHQITLQGIAEGETQLNVFSPDGKRLFEAIVRVNSERGHQVRIYGTGKNEDVNSGFVSTYCNEISCGRPDRDLPTPAVTVERVSRPRDQSRILDK